VERTIQRPQSMLAERFESDGCEVRAQRLEEFGRADIDEWLGLESHAVEGNCFLSPCFVLPAARHLAPASNLIVIRIWSGAPRRLIGLGVFEIQAPTRRRPLSCLVAFRTVHTFSTGLLLDKSAAAAALHGFVRYVSLPDQPWHAVEFTDLNVSGPFGAAFMEHLEQEQCGWCEREGYRRAVLDLAAEAPVSKLTPSYKRDLNRLRRRLQDSGKLEFVVTRGSAMDARQIEEFLRLENLGWKGRGSSSLLARAHHAAFFREIVAAFAERDRAFFYHLTLDGVTIASASNFTAEDVGYAFKIGWDPRYARFSPGSLNELAFLEWLPDHRLSVRRIDSGALAGSFIERLWKDSCSMSMGYVPTSAHGRMMLSLMKRAWVARRVGSRLLRKISFQD